MVYHAKIVRYSETSNEKKLRSSYILLSFFINEFKKPPNGARSYSQIMHGIISANHTERFSFKEEQKIASCDRAFSLRRHILL